mmetsp:Transcript_49012/g.79002  ORF Transcript_49012/g.79002 Transcript_49012/m.79002 type:complete len:206 (-) Transcript_49012:103-720(-)
MRAAQGHDLLVVESLPVEDSADVRNGRGFCALVCIGQTTIRCAPFATGLVGTASAERHLRATHLFNRNVRGKNPEIGKSETRELGFHGLQSKAGFAQACVGTVLSLWREAHRGAVRTACLAGGIVRARCVPGQTNQHRPDGAIVIVLLVKNLDHGILDLGIVDLGLGIGKCSHGREADTHGRGSPHTPGSRQPPATMPASLLRAG